MKTTNSIKGAGIGLRSEHYQTILNERPSTPWLEALTDNYMGAGGLPLYHLEKIREHYPITFHGVGLSLGSTDPINKQYLSQLKALVNRFEPVHVSDHLAWVSVNNHYAHELLPFPYSQEALNLIANKINQVQDFMGTPLIVENPSTYLEFKQSEMPEWQFIQELIAKTGCQLLLDVNNIYVSATNHGFSTDEYINAIPAASVKEIHLAGYEENEHYLFDTHGYKIRDGVWDLYKKTIATLGNIPTLIEWDTDIPEYTVLQKEASKAQHYLNQNNR